MLVFCSDDEKGITESVDGAEFDFVEFSLTKGEYAGIKYLLEFDVCPDPLCSCEVMTFLVANADEDKDDFYEFNVDINEKKFVEKEENSPDLSRVKKFSSAMLSELTESDWEEIEDVFFTAKADLAENFDPRAAVAPLKFESRDEPVYYYDEIFPFAEPFYVSADQDHPLVAVDSYIVEADYKGCEVFLLLHPVIEDEDVHSDEPGDDGVAGVIVVDYVKKTLVRVDSESQQFNCRNVFTALVRENEDMWERLALRHKNLKEFYVKFLSNNPVRNP